MKRILIILLFACIWSACSGASENTNTQQNKIQEERTAKVNAINVMLKEIEFVTSKGSEWELVGINTEDENLLLCSDTSPCQIHIRDKTKKHDDLYVKIVIQQFVGLDGIKYWKAYKLNFLLDDSN